MTNTTLFNPHLINLHLGLHHHLADSYPLFAHHLHISTTQARLGMHAAIDASFVFLVKQAQAPLTPPSTQEPSTFAQKKHNKLIYEHCFDTTTLTHLPMTLAELFFENVHAISQHIATLAKIDNDSAKTLLGLVATLSAHYTDRLSDAGNLNINERMQWLCLQVLFLQTNPSTPSTDSAYHSDALADYITLAKLSLTPPVNTYSEYHDKLGLKNKVLFDQSLITMPNHAWLIALAQNIDANHLIPLTIGKTLTPTPKITPKPSADVQKDNAKNYKKPLILGAFISLIIAVVAALTTGKKEEDAPKPATTPDIPQDVAIVRVEEGSTNTSDTTNTNTTNSSATSISNTKENNTKDK